MSFNFSNLGQQALESLIPIFQSMANGVVMPAQANFINQLTAAATAANTSLNANKTNTPINIRTPEPPPAPRLSSSPIGKVKPNKGTAPMDLDNELENEQMPTRTSTNMCSSTTLSAKTTPSNSNSNMNNVMMNVPDTSLYLNGLMANNVAMNAGLMFFPTAGAAINNPTSASSNTMPQLDTSAMMAAVMQRNYTGSYSFPDISAGDANKIGLTSDNFNNNLPMSVKEVIKTNSCILLPPNPNAPAPTMREKPPGCRTVFVGGLPENTTEEILREIFENCGDITTLRTSKKNFCHIRFRSEDSIDKAIFLSGYRIRLGNTNEPANCGRLHVDYAQARDDQYDYECRQRQLQREQRHRERRSQDRSNSESNSPPPIPHYSDHEASLVADHLRNHETFVKAMQTITVWLERGDCSKRNANIFYSMIQSTHSHVRRLTGDKQLLEEDLRKARTIYRKQMLAMTTQFTQIEKMFSAASHKKVWDHFTKAQRKNIDHWKKLATELRSIQIDDDDEMEMSDDGYCYGYQISRAKRKRYESDHLKEENDSLRCQLEAVRNEMSLERTDLRCNSEFREKQIKVLQETIRNMQTQLLQTKMREQKDKKSIEQLERRLKEAGVKQLLLKTKIRETTGKLKDREHLSGHSLEYDKAEIIDIDLDISDDDVKIVEDLQPNEESDKNKIMEITTKNHVNDQPNNNTVMKPKSASSTLTTDTTAISYSDKPTKETTIAETKLIQPLPVDDAKLVALTTALLIIQPLGCTTAAICSYIKNVTKDSSLECHELNSILEKYVNLFQPELTSDINEKKVISTDKSAACTVWKFCGFASSSALS